VYVEDLDPNYILAIARTAPRHQVEMLRDAIWKHIALQTAIRIKIVPFRFPVFRLQFQLPYLALRPIYLPPDPMGVQRKPIDVSLLGISIPGRYEGYEFGIREAQISFVMCGPDNETWAAYALVDTRLEEINGPDDEEELEDENNDNDD